MMKNGRMKNGAIGVVTEAEGAMRDGEDEINVFDEGLGSNEILTAGSSGETFTDDLTGLPLDPELCRAARQKKIDYFRSKEVWEIRPYAEARARMGRRPISVRSVETSKGDDEHLNVRSRLVAREIRMAGEDVIFAPTPPFESLRMVLSMATTELTGGKGKARSPVYDPDSEERMHVMLIDISRAYFNAKTDDCDPIYVQIPPEASAKDDQCALLWRHMHGTRRAAEGWQDEYSSRLREAGFTQGAASPCVFAHSSRGITVSMHGDDFTACGPKCELDWFEETLRSHYELTVGGRLGPGKTDGREATVLNRITRWTEEGIEYEADPRQIEKLLEEFDLDGDGVNGVVTPGAKAQAHQVQDEKELPMDQHTRFRALAASANYLAADRPDGVVYEPRRYAVSWPSPLI